MNWIRELWHDERGAVLSAEVVTVGTVAVLGAVAGLSAAANAVDGEMKDFAYAIRSLDQSYEISGHRSCGAWTAGSCYIQRPVQESIQALCAEPTNPGEVVTPEAQSPTPIITPDTDAPKPNDLPAPAKKGAKKKAKEKKDNDDDRSPSKPPKARDDDDA